MHLVTYDAGGSTCASLQRLDGGRYACVHEGDVMYDRPGALPQFERPPVTEVRMEMVFEPLSIRVTDLPSLFATWGDRYPELSESAPQPVSLEPGPGHAEGARLRIEFSDQPPIPLIRFRDENRSRWIELQSDRLSCGWSRVSEDEYPRYPKLRQEFQQLALELAAFVSDEQIQVVQLNLVYVNEFELEEGNPLVALADAYCFGPSPMAFDELPPLLDAGFDLRFAFTHEDARYAVLTARSRVSRGREASTSRLRLRFSGDPFGAPGAEERDGFTSILAFFDQGHDAIVRTFAQATDESLHQQWGRYE